VVEIDPCAVVLVLMDKDQADLSKVQPPSPSPPNGSSGHSLDQYA
jgi:hypothetical protein